MRSVLLSRVSFRLLALAFAGSALAQAPKCPPTTGHIDIQSGDYGTQSGVTFRLRHFSASLVPQATTAPLCYGKYTVVSHAEIFVSNESLTHVFASKLSETESKIKDFTVTNSADGVTLSGEITKVVPIHFSIFGPVTTDGVGLQLHAQKIKADGIAIKLLLELVGKHLSDVLGMKDVAGVQVEGDIMSFFPERIAHLKGHLRSVTTSAEGVKLVYGAPAVEHRTRAAAPAQP